MSERCETCRFYIGLESGEHCRRYPPTFFLTMKSPSDVFGVGLNQTLQRSTGFAVTDKRWWCGEYAAKET